MKHSDVIKRFKSAETEKQKYKPLWREISKYTGIMVDSDNIHNDGDDLDSYTLDPTTSLSNIQSADYLKGIIIGTGAKGVELVPTDEVLQLADISSVKHWYDFASGVVVKEVNHPQSGFHTAFQTYFYDQMSFGNSGVGVFKNQLNNSTANTLIFKEYGIDSTSIEEGKNGVVDVIFTQYKWKTGQFVSEFCHRNNAFDEEMFGKLPEKVKQAYNNSDFQKEFKVVHAIMPNDEYQPEKLGKLGAKYVGFWFLNDGSNNIFFEESFNERPISFGRPIKVRGETYGRAYGTMLLSSIRCVNEIINGLMITLDKYREPAMGLFGDAISGNTVINTTAGSVTTFDPTKLNGNTPMFQLQDIGDPTPIINFLLPYFNEKLATAFKVDLLLDFSADANMTATESLQRYSIRNKSILGLVIQQINDVYIPVLERAVSILLEEGKLGVMPTDDIAQSLMETGYQKKIIPDAVLQVMKQGKRWYTIKFTNEIEKIANTDKLDNLVQMLNIAQAILSVNPQLAGAVDWFKLLKETSSALGFESAIMSESEFKKQIMAQQQAQAMAQQAQLEQMNSVTMKNKASAIRDLSNGTEQSSPVF